VPETVLNRGRCAGIAPVDVLAAQFGYLPGTLWILIGALLAGAVQDFVILFASVRRDGKSLAEMVREEVSSVAGTIAMFAILGILVILVANLALVVDNALAESPWWIVTTAMTMPFAMIMGLYLRFLRIGNYFNPNALHPMVTITTSRGCPFNCSYCGAQVIWKRKVRRRSVSKIINEIQYLIGRSGSRSISFWDDSFTCDRKYTLELTEALRKIDGVKYSCITRLDLIDEDSLSRLRNSGCCNILFGIESGNDDILKCIDKKMTRDIIKKKVGLVETAGIPWLGFFIMGYLTFIKR